MFNVPARKQLVPVLVGLEAPPIFLQPLPHVAAGEGPGERVALTGSAAMAQLYDAYARARRQLGGEPVMVIAAADSSSGRGLIAKRRGLELLDELTGPLVWAWTEERAAEQLGAAGWAHLSAALDAIGHADGGMRVLLAVNGSGIEARVFRMGEPPAPAAERAP